MTVTSGSCGAKVLRAESATCPRLAATIGQQTSNNGPMTQNRHVFRPGESDIELTAVYSKDLLTRSVDGTLFVAFNGRFMVANASHL